MTSLPPCHHPPIPPRLDEDGEVRVGQEGGGLRVLRFVCVYVHDRVRTWRRRGTLRKRCGRRKVEAGRNAEEESKAAEKDGSDDRAEKYREQGRPNNKLRKRKRLKRSRKRKRSE